ncbi:MAG: hypothetical protein VX910_00745, partial [Candidatus Latescibacterota bacterium]|nr:hypothetical protein [Candidatus Latescibacterota bacterium]
MRRAALFAALLGIAAPDTVVGNMGDDTLESDQLFIGGCGGLYLLAEPGDLVIEIIKKDRNTRSNPTNLKAILLGPDRRHLDEILIPDDGQAKGSGFGKIQSATLSTQVEQKGVYVVNVTVTHDRYGEDILWGFKSNCPKYLIETSRGHKDGRHLEPIVLGNPEGSADVCFTAHSKSIDISASDLISENASLILFDGSGKRIAEIPVSENGEAAYTIPSEAR